MNGYGNAGKVLMDSIRKMTPIKKDLITSYYYNNLTIQELSRIHNKEPITIYQMLKETRQELIQSLKDNKITEADYTQPLSFGTELFLLYGEGAVQTAESIQKEEKQQ